MNKGVIFLITGNSYSLRLMVALCSLRRVYHGPVTVLYNDHTDIEFIEKLLEYDVCDVEKIESGKGKSGTQLTKSRLDELTPYDVTVFLDADVLVLREFVAELFEIAEEHEFVATQMKDWTSASKPIMKRYRGWINSGAEHKDLMQAAWDAGADLPGLNTGVFAFKKDAEIFKDWHSVSKAGFDKKVFIAEEIACNALMASGNGIIVGPEFNASCRFHDDREYLTAKCIHYHGVGHVRLGKSRGSSEHWCRYFESMRKHDSKFPEIVRRWSQRKERIYMADGEPGKGYQE